LRAKLGHARVNGLCVKRPQIAGDVPEPYLMEDAIERWQPPKGMNTLYIATNKPYDERVRALKKALKLRGLRGITWEDVPRHARPELGGGREGVDISLIEQHVCITAQSFIASWPSSWDETVVAYRLAEPSAEDLTALENMHDSFVRNMGRSCSGAQEAEMKPKP